MKLHKIRSRTVINLYVKLLSPSVSLSHLFLPLLCDNLISVIVLHALASKFPNWGGFQEKTFRPSHNKNPY